MEIVVSENAKRRVLESSEALQPVTQTERIRSLDILRGFSLLGILLMNIAAFALPSWDYMFPLATIKPVFSGPHAALNTTLWFIRWVTAEGKMRALFSMLFGAGVILMTSRAERRGAGVQTADIFVRRNMWLMVIGVVHAYLIWWGDILFFYGVSALLFLFPFRHVKAKHLICASFLVLLVNSYHNEGARYLKAVNQRKAAEMARSAETSHRELNSNQRAAISAWQEAETSYRPSADRLSNDIAAKQKGYWQYLKQQGNVAQEMESVYLYAGIGDIVGMMLLGMALYRLGFLTGQLSTKTYLLSVFIGLGIAWSIGFAGAWDMWKSGFDQIEVRRIMMFTFDITRAAGAIGTAAAVVLLSRLRVLSRLMNGVAAVGQTALSNYILTSICMQLLFVWGPLHWYGYLEYFKLYYVVAAMWAVSLIWSPLWLHFFRFGPVEWLWRSLTYWGLQPIRRGAQSSLV